MKQLFFITIGFAFDAKEVAGASDSTALKFFDGRMVILVSHEMVGIVSHTETRSFVISVRV